MLTAVCCRSSCAHAITELAHTTSWRHAHAGFKLDAHVNASGAWDWDDRWHQRRVLAKASPASVFGPHACCMELYSMCSLPFPASPARLCTPRFSAPFTSIACSVRVHHLPLQMPPARCHVYWTPEIVNSSKNCCFFGADNRTEGCLRSKACYLLDTSAPFVARCILSFLCHECAPIPQMPPPCAARCATFWTPGTCGWTRPGASW